MLRSARLCRMLAKISQILGDPIVAVLPELCMEKHKDRRKHARRGLCAPLPHGVRSFIPTPQPITVFVCVGVAFFSAAAELGTRWKHALAAHTFFLVESPMIIAMTSCMLTGLSGLTENGRAARMP